MKIFFLKLYLIYVIFLTLVSFFFVEVLLFTTMLFQDLKKRLIRETERLLNNHERMLHNSRSKE